MEWRWDQGRLQYLTFDNLRLAAQGLLALDGSIVNQDPDVLRPVLMDATGLPYSPSSYKVWRNYARVYKSALLATSIDDVLRCTAWCEQLAREDEDAPSADDYLAHFARNFAYPSPAFEEYSSIGPVVYPVCALLKLLASKAGGAGIPSVDVEEVFEKLIANACTGLEALPFYTSLRRRAYTPKGDEPRQVRELLRFVSQFSFLKWHQPHLLLDIAQSDPLALQKVLEVATPVVQAREPDPDREVLRQGALSETPYEAPEIRGPAQVEDEDFVEGKRVRVSHLRAERSYRLRKAFFQSLEEPIECDVCELHPPDTYPWVSHLLEIHHLLPLSSAVRVESARTSLRDLVPICPNCHRAIHLYYKGWLNRNGQADFADREQALTIYDEAKELVA